LDTEQTLPMSVVTIVSSGSTSRMSDSARRGLNGSPSRDDHVASSSAQLARSSAIRAILASSRGRSGCWVRSASSRATAVALASPLMPRLIFLVSPSTRWSTSTWMILASAGQ
jgi:hypothetical protein